MKIFVDGSCIGNGSNNSSGGYGVVIFDNENNYISHYSHYEKNTTNNIQELKSLIYSFTIAYQYPSKSFIIYSDSSYGIQVFESWSKNWERNNWRKSDGQIIKNLELIKEGYQLYKQLNNISLVKVKGHNDIIGNEMADALATNNIDKFYSLLNKNRRELNE